MKPQRQLRHSPAIRRSYSPQPSRPLPKPPDRKTRCRPSFFLQAAPAHFPEVAQADIDLIRRYLLDHHSFFKPLQLTFLKSPKQISTDQVVILILLRHFAAILGFPSILLWSQGQSITLFSVSIVKAIDNAFPQFPVQPVDLHPQIVERNPHL